MSGWKRHFDNLSEPFRSAVEYKNLRAAWDDLLSNAPSGDGHPVLVLPGFTANDGLTSTLREAIEEKGYKVYGWEKGRNLGLDEKTADHLRQHLEKIFAENGNKKVTLIGHSLGGIYARELAREFPELVRGVITIGSPFGVGLDKDSVPAAVKMVFEWVNHGKKAVADEDMINRMLTPPPVPTTSIFSKTDGIVDWKASLNPAAPETENIEVAASHIGLVWSPDAFKIVFDRLAQPEGTWKSYAGASSEIPPENPEWKQGHPPKNLFRKN